MAVVMELCDKNNCERPMDCYIYFKGASGIRVSNIYENISKCWKRNVYESEGQE